MLSMSYYFILWALQLHHCFFMTCICVAVCFSPSVALIKSFQSVQKWRHTLWRQIFYSGAVTKCSGKLRKYLLSKEILINGQIRWSSVMRLGKIQLVMKIWTKCYMMQTAKARKVEKVARNKALNKTQKSRKIAFFLFFPAAWRKNLAAVWLLNNMLNPS